MRVTLSSWLSVVWLIRKAVWLQYFCRQQFKRKTTNGVMVKYVTGNWNSNFKIRQAFYVYYIKIIKLSCRLECKLLAKVHSCYILVTQMLLWKHCRIWGLSG